MTTKLWTITIIAAVLAGILMSSGTFFWIIMFALGWANMIRLIKGLKRPVHQHEEQVA